MVIFAYPDNNLSNIVDFIRYTDSTTALGGSGLLGGTMLMIIGIVAFMSTKAYSSDRAFGFASFLVFICAIFFRFMNLIGDGVLVVTIILMAASILLLMKERDEETFGV